MNDTVFLVHGASGEQLPPSSLVLDSPHLGRVMPADFNSVCSVAQLREGEDCFIDELYLPATARGVPLLAAQFPRTYLDANRHAGDIDLELLSEPWPGDYQPSSKGSIGKSLLWRTLDADRPLYAHRLSAAAVQARIDRYHRPYHARLQQLLDAAHQAHGVVHHINCHSMGANSTLLIEGVAGVPRADMVLGDRDGSTCDPAFTAFVRDALQACGYQVAVNDPFKGVELVRAYSRPVAGRHSLQLEVNKRLYMDDQTLSKNTGFATLQAHLMQVLVAVEKRFTPQFHTPSRA